MEEQLVYLKCVKEGPKLRVKITSAGYFHDANCRFPRDIRVDGRRYSVPSSAISFSEGSAGKFFYMIKKSGIKIVNGDVEESEGEEKKVLKIYEDTTVVDCVICMSAGKEVVFAVCGHYCTCEACAIKIKNTTKKCPICRTAITAIVKRENIE
jgi:hypothetical protein